MSHAFVRGREGVKFWLIIEDVENWNPNLFKCCFQTLLKNSTLQESYNTPLEHTQGNTPSQL